MVHTPRKPAVRYLTREGRPSLKVIGISRDLSADLYHLLLNRSWPGLMGMVLVGYIGLNAFFAELYLLGGDTIENARPGSFTDAFFFSVQTMATIGYGKMTAMGMYANILVTLEALTGIIITAMFTGLFFAKFSRPTAQVMFSRNAVITQRDGVRSLLYRLANRRLNQISEATLHLVMARNEKTLEGESIRRFYDLKLARDKNSLFALSWTAIHPITPDSPLYGQTRESLAAAGVELLATVMGLDEDVSQTMHARHTWGSEDILWNAHFVDLFVSSPEGPRSVDFTRFHDVVIDLEAPDPSQPA